MDNTSALSISATARVPFVKKINHGSLVASSLCGEAGGCCEAVDEKTRAAYLDRYSKSARFPKAKEFLWGDIKTLKYNWWMSWRRSGHIARDPMPNFPSGD